jgi:LacI family transcriptional regulator
MAGKPTIDDIARLAGVSKTTVSRVLNHKPDVDPATRRHVLQIMEEQGYVPSITASGLAGGRSRLIGMLVPSFTWPNIPELMRGIAGVIEQTPYEMVLYSINETNTEQNRSAVINRIFATQLTAGLLAIFPGQLASEPITKLYNKGFPVVVIDDQVMQTAPWVGADNTTGAYLAVRHLIHLGHRRIAHIQGPEEYLVSQDRYNGYLQALLEAGITPDPELVLRGDFLPLSGRVCASTFFEMPVEKRPTAIFAATDQMAYGVLAAAETYGLNVPRDIALVGFDDDEPSVHIRPPLTTVRQPSFEMGQRGIELLLSIIAAAREDELDAPVQTPLESSPARIILPTNLIVRASCGADFSIPVSSE